MDTDQQYFTKPKEVVNYSVVQVSIWSAFVILGILFITLDWPGLSILLISSGGLLGYNIIGWFLLRGKSMANNIILGVGIVWAIILFAGAIFNNGIPCNENGLLIHGVAAGIVAGINALANRKHFANQNS